jgi:hypothetical protein
MEIKTPNYTETPLPSAPPAEGNQPLPAAISDATKYLIQVLDPMGVKIESQDLSQISLEGLRELLDKTEALLTKLMPSAPPLEPETPTKPIPSAPPLPPPESNQALMAPAVRFAMAQALNANTNALPQRAFTGIAPRTSLPANPPVVAFGKTAVTNPRSSGSLGENGIKILSKETSQNTKKPNTFFSTSEQARSTSTKSAQKEPFLQNATLADAAVESESVGFAFSETVSFSAETLLNEEREEQIVVQTEETAETQASQESGARVESTKIFVSEERTVDALLIEKTAQESEKESTEESTSILNEGKEFAMITEQEDRSMLKEIPSLKISNSRSKELFFSTNSPFAQERRSQNQLDERSPLTQNSRPLATLPNLLKSLEYGANPLQSPASEKRILPSELAQESSLPSAIKSPAPSSQMLSPVKAQTPFPSSMRQILTALKSSQELTELSLEQSALTLSSTLAQSPNNTLIIPYSTLSPIQSSSPSKTAGTGSLQPVAEFSDEDFDEDEEEEDEEDEEEEDDLFEDLNK